MNLIDKAYNYNKKVFHEKYANVELHHVANRQGIALCCLRLFYPAKPGHQLDYKWVEMLREKYRDDYKRAKTNYVKNMYCKCKIFPECEICGMPKALDKFQ